MQAKRSVQVTWPKILKATEDVLETRAFIVARYRDAGFSLDRFASGGPERAFMADTLTRAEDVLETLLGSKAKAARAKIKPLRRALEEELT